MENLSKANHDYLKMSELATTIQGRPLHLLTITDPRNLLSRSDRIKQDLEDDKVVEPEEDDDDDDEDDGVELDGKKGNKDRRSPTPT